MTHYTKNYRHLALNLQPQATENPPRVLDLPNMPPVGRKGRRNNNSIKG